jgi:outer membrane protein assembly factor BamB
VGDAIIASHIVVLLVRSLTIAAVIALIASSVWGQQPKRKRELYIAPLLPAEQAWKVSLPAAPAAAAAMDSATVYVPLVARLSEEAEEETPARLVALHRENGSTRWTIPLETRHPPLVTQGAVIVATSSGVQALDPENAAVQWSVALDRPVRAPMLAQGPLLLALLEGDELAAIHLERREVAWRRSIGESATVFMTADAEAAYLTTVAGRAMRVRLADGEIEWERKLAGALTAPTIDRDRLFVGSNAEHGSLWALEARTGKEKWSRQSRVIGGPVIGTAVHGESVYVVSLDNMVRAFKRSNGNLRWDEPAARPIAAPRIFNGIVTVVGSSPTLSTFRSESGTAVSTWDRPRDSLLQGAPLIDPPAPFRVAIVVVFRDGQVVGLKPTGMLFKEPPPTRPTTLPGRQLPRESIGGG